VRSAIIVDIIGCENDEAEHVDIRPLIDSEKPQILLCCDVVPGPWCLLGGDPSVTRRMQEYIPPFFFHLQIRPPCSVIPSGLPYLLCRYLGRAEKIVSYVSMLYL